MQTGAVCCFPVFFGRLGARASEDCKARASEILGGRASEHSGARASEHFGADALVDADADADADADEPDSGTRLDADLYIGGVGAFDFGRVVLSMVVRLRD